MKWRWKGVRMRECNKKNWEKRLSENNLGKEENRELRKEWENNWMERGIIHWSQWKETSVTG